jgi:GAF domain-containing protein
LITDLQRSLREGPVLDALRGGVPTRTTSLGDDPRWPRLAAHQAELAVSSVLAVPLIGPRGPFGTLVCYAPETAVFGTDAEALAASLASLAALLYAARELEANLRAGMETRERIGQAVGVLMERHRLTSQQAFDLLVYVSQRTHRKLREIANWVTETGEDPHVFLKQAESV